MKYLVKTLAKNCFKELTALRSFRSCSLLCQSHLLSVMFAVQFRYIDSMNSIAVNR